MTRTKNARELHTDVLFETDNVAQGDLHILKLWVKKGELVRAYGGNEDDQIWSISLRNTAPLEIRKYHEGQSPFSNHWSHRVRIFWLCIVRSLWYRLKCCTVIGPHENRHLCISLQFSPRLADATVTRRSTTYSGQFQMQSPIFHMFGREADTPCLVQGWYRARNKLANITYSSGLPALHAHDAPLWTHQKMQYNLNSFQLNVSEIGNKFPNSVL